MPESARRAVTQKISGFAAHHARSLSGLLLLGVLAVVAALSVLWLSDPSRFPLDVVEVKGDFRYLQKQQLQAAVAPHAAGGFFTVNVVAVRRAAEDLPWVARAKVRRVWPATLRVLITEQQPVAGWNADGFLNAAGEAFFPRPGAAPDKLPQLAGPQGQGPKVLEKYRQVEQTLRPLGMRVARFALDSRRAWSLQLDNGVQLRLGRTRPWHRLQRFVRAFPEVFAGRLAGVQRVDMRYSNGFSVYRQQAVLQGAVGQRDAAG